MSNQPRFCNVNVQYLSEVQSEILDSHVNIIQSPCGTGKTNLIKNVLEEKIISNPEIRILVITFRRSLASKLSKDFGFESYLNLGHKRKIDFDIEHPRLVISIESLRKILRESSTGQAMPLPRIFILDEYKSVIEHLVNTTTLSGESRKLFIELFHSVCTQDTLTVLLADAYLTVERDLPLLTSLVDGKCEKLNWIVNAYKNPIKRKIYIYNKPKLWFKDVFKHLLENQEKNYYVFSSSKKALDAMEQKYRSIIYPEQSTNDEKNEESESWCTMDIVEDKRVLLSRDSTDSEKKQYSQSPDRTWSENRIVWVTPTISTGISFDKEHFSKAFGWGDGPVSPLGFLQQLMRSRKLLENEVLIYIPKAPKKSLVKDYDLVKEKILNDDLFILSHLEELEQWTKAKFAQMIESNSYFVQENFFNVSFDKKSLLNKIVLENFRTRFLKTFEFENELIRLAKIDNYEFHKRDVSEKTSDENPDREVTVRIHKDSVKLNTDFYKIPFWNGVLSDELVLEGGKSKTTFGFIKNWNLLGYRGEIHHFKRDIENPAKSLRFNRKRLGIFMTEFGDEEKQLRFHKLFTRRIEGLFEEDIKEMNFNSLQFDASFYHICALYFQAYGVASVITHKITNFFGSSDVGVYKIVAPNSLDELSCGFFDIVNESRLNHETRYQKLREETIIHWTSIFTHLEIKGFSDMVVHADIVNHEHINNKSIRCFRKIMRSMLNYFGLKRDHKSCFSERPNAYHSNNVKDRVILYRYEVGNLRDRLMISVLRLSKKFEGGRRHRYYPVADPFRLLEDSVEAEIDPFFSYLYNCPTDASQEEKQKWIFEFQESVRAWKPTTLDNVRDRFVHFQFRETDIVSSSIVL